jgi:bacterioferritin (cytochrome b1)
MSSDDMDTEAVQKALGVALDHQGKSVLTLTVLAGSMSGTLGTALKPTLRQFVASELEDTYLLVEKLSSLGGAPAFDVGQVQSTQSSSAALEELLELERAGVAALHEVIPHTGQQPHSEALEHLLEHMIMRKQQQIDFLVHATREG